MTINSIRFGPSYVELELELVELDPKDDLELELESEPKLESELEKEIENKEGPLGLTAFCPAVEEIENEEGLLGLTLLCPAVEEELSGEDGIMTRVLSSADETLMVRRRTL